MTMQEYTAWLRELASQPIFGKHDRLGTANYIDETARFRGLRSATHARTYSLAQPMQGGDNIRGDDRPIYKLDVYRTQQDEQVIGSDHLELDCHGQRATHLDALNHMGFEGTWYAGWPIGGSNGPSVSDFAEHGLFTRGIVADVPRLRGTDWVQSHEPVTGADLDGCMEKAGVSFERGDALLLYMGRDVFDDLKPQRQEGPRPGLGHEAAPWLLDNGVSVLAWDFADAHHNSNRIALHMLIWAIGLILIDNCNFARVIPDIRSGMSAAGAFFVAPLPLKGATGCVVNPILIL